MSDFDEFMEDFLNADSSGGGYVAEVQLRPGYKVFISGHGDDTSFFPVSPANPDQAKVAAEVFAAEHGKKAHRALQLLIWGDTVLNRDKPTWQNNNVRSHSFPTFTDAAKALLNSMIEVHGSIIWNDKIWAQISYKPDPSGRQSLNQRTGEMEVKPVPYFSQVFANEGEARTFVGADPSAPLGLEPLYEKYADNPLLDKQTLDDAFAEIKKAVHNKQSVPAIYKSLLGEDGLEFMVTLAENTPAF